MTHYTRHTKALFSNYRQMDFTALHADWLQHLTKRSDLAGDISAERGRKANRQAPTFR